MSHSHSNLICRILRGSFGSYEGKGQTIRIQERAALIPRESVSTEDHGAQGRLGTLLAPLKTTSSFSLEELPSSLLHLPGPHQLQEPVVPGVSTLHSNCTKRPGARNRALDLNARFLHHCSDSQSSCTADQSCMEELLEGTRVFHDLHSPTWDPTATCRVVNVLMQVRN